MKWIKKIIQWFKETFNPYDMGGPFVGGISEEQLDRIESHAEERRANRDPDEQREPYDGMEP